MRSWRRPSDRDEPRLTAARVGAAAALALLVLSLLVRHVAEVKGDDLIYERMADAPFATHTFPFGYRVGLPSLVHVLPLSHDVSFPLLALLCAGAAAGCLFALMTDLGSGRGLAAASSVAFAISPVMLVVTLRDGRSVDAATVLVMVAATLLIVRRRYGALALVLLAGAFVRESTPFLIPFAYAVWAERWLDRRALVRAALAGLPAVVAYVALRLSIPTVGRELVVGYNEPFLDARRSVIESALGDGTDALRRAFLAFGPLWLVAPLALRDMRFARRGLVLLALCAVAMTYALDWGRILFLAAPVVYPAAGWALERRPRWKVPVLGAWIALCLVYAVYMDVYGVEHNIDGGEPPTYPVR